MSPALEGRFVTTGPPAKSPFLTLEMMKLGTEKLHNLL